MTRSPDLERRIVDVLQRQATELKPPSLHADEIATGVGVVDAAGRGRSTGYVFAGAVAAILLAVVGVWIFASDDPTTDARVAGEGSEPDTGAAADPTLDDDSSGGDDAPSHPAPVFDYATTTVRLRADSIVVDVPGGQFSPPTELRAGGDPGSHNEYTTLELTWPEPETEGRLYIYFQSDGAEWWSEEIRVYDGNTEPGWVYAAGEFFRSPLGTAFTGDLDVGYLQIEGLTLEAFLPPAGCGDETGLLLSPRFTVIPGTGSWSADLLDAATCEPVDIGGYERTFAVADADIATVIDGDLPGQLPTGMVRFNIEAKAVGETVVIVEVRAAGVVVATAEIPVVIDELVLHADTGEPG